MALIKNAGEVAAISGYGFQYEVLATEMYSCLLNHEVNWVEFASSSAGKLDDVLIGLDDKIIAYQVKQISSSKFSYSQFTDSETESILQGVYKGWKNLKHDYPNLRIDARFITTQEVSESDAISKFGGTSKPSFKKFIKNLWKPIQEKKYDHSNIPVVWQSILSELSIFVSATNNEFIEFIKDFSFVFDYKIDDYLYDTYTQAKRSNHIESITKNIFRLVSKNGNVKYTKSQILSEFGLKNQYETHFQHSFFIDEKHYQPIVDTIDILKAIVDRKPKGYIALVGNAGSGKSTMLTKWLSDRNYRVLKYYAYTNVEMGYDFGFRGEATFFLHDILVQIRENKLTLQDRLPENDLLDLQKQFHEELLKVSHLNQKVFIIVDGLDHIEREQKVNRSLIDVLPNPQNIPSNVYFILGSRTIEQLRDLSFEINEELTSSNSVVTISPLSKANILKLTTSYRIALQEKLFELLYVNTKGHPLFLRYTLEELKSSKEEQYEAIIEGKKFTGDIYREYRKFWDKYKDYDDFIHILGIISRFRYPYFDTDLLHKFKIKRSDTSKVNAVAEFYFYKSNNIWQFFHNSFKEFLIEESAKNPYSNSFDATIDCDYHIEIAKVIKEVENDYRFNVLFHLFKAERHHDILELISQNFFRDQWFAFRNNQIIFEDIKLASQSCFYQKDLNALTTCFLSSFELEQRVTNFSPKAHYEIFLLVGWLDVANSFVFNNARLLTDNHSALKYARELFQEGYKLLAFELFERATPVNLLDKSTNLNTRRYNQQDYSETNEVLVVVSWAVTASLFLPFEEILEKIRGISVENEGYNDTLSDPLLETLSEIADFYIEKEDWHKVEEITEIIDIEFGQDEKFYFYFELIDAVDKENELYQKCLSFFEAWSPGEDNGINIRYLLIYTLFETDIPKCKPILQSLVTPRDLSKGRTSSDEAGISNYIFNYSRLFYIVTKDFAVLPETLIPFAEKPAFNAFYLAFAELGRSYAWRFYDYHDASAVFFRSIDRVLDIFHHAFLDPLYEYRIDSEKAELIKLILRVSSRISDNLFTEVLSKISNEWQNKRQFWSRQHVQQVIESVAAFDRFNTWCIQELEILDNYIFDDGYINQRIEDGVKQVKLWAKVGERERAEKVIQRLMSIALDVRGEDDSQLDYIVGWISKVGFDRRDDIQFIFDRLHSINDKVNSPSHTPAKELLKLSLSMGNGFNVFQYLLFDGLEEFNDGMESILSYLFENFEPTRMLSLKTFTRIVLSLDNRHGNRSDFINTFFKSNPSLNEVAILINDVKIYSILEARNDYLFEIQKHLLKLEIAPIEVGLYVTVEKKKDNSSSTPNTLTLRSGISLTEEDLSRNINTLDDLIAIEAEAEPHNYFKWTNLIIKIIQISTDVELESYLEAKDLDSVQLSNIAEVLIDNGKISLSKKIINRALDKSKSSGWITIYDGGSKLCAYEQLRRVESKSICSNKAFKDFAESIGEFDLRSMEILLKDLDNIFELFSDTVDKNEVYGEILKYRNELLKNQTVNDRLISISCNKSKSELVTDLLYFLITFPSNLCEVIFPVLVEESSKFKSIINNILEKLFENGFSVKFVQLLAGLLKKDREYLEENERKLKKLVASDRFDIFQIATRLLATGRIACERVVTITEIPISYTLELTAKRGIITSNQKPVDNIDESGFLKDTSDPLIYTQIFLYDIRKLAKITGFNEYNIAYRVMLLGNDSQFPDWCSSLDEEALRGIYDRFSLKISYARPQVQKVIDGLMQVVMELLDLNLIDIEDAHDLGLPFDEDLYFITVTERPSFVASILSKSDSAPSASRAWAKSISVPYLSDVLKLFYDDNYILAERTTLLGMGHGSATEVRQSIIEISTKIDNKRHTIFNLTYNSKMEDYLSLEDSGICLCNFVSTVDPKETWLAINPLLAVEMGLKINRTVGNFRWDNEKGEKVVESIYWQESDISNKSGHHNSEAGNGWAVILTKAGLGRLKNVLEGRKLFHHKKVERTMTYVQKRYNTSIDEEASEYSCDEVGF